MSIDIKKLKVGDVLEGDEGKRRDRIKVNYIGGQILVCDWDHGANGNYDAADINTSLSCREWKKVSGDNPAKPEGQEWNDEGLPPADIECEVFDHEEKQYSRCKTLSAATMSGERACATIEPKGHFGRLIWGVNFRPIRTQAQREREEIIIDALRHVDDPRDDEVHPRQYFMDALHTLYDAGMLRKEAE